MTNPTCPHCHATVLSTSQPERMDEVLRLLRKISDLAYDEDVGEPLDCAIDYANKAIAALAATPAFEINPFANEPAATPVVGGERKALEIGRQEIVLAIAFLGRDNGTHRMPNSVQSLIKRLAIADKAILAALRAPPVSPLRGRKTRDALNEIRTIALGGWSNRYDQDFGTKDDEYKLDSIREQVDIAHCLRAR